MLNYLETREAWKVCKWQHCRDALTSFSTQRCTLHNSYRALLI